MPHVKSPTPTADPPTIAAGNPFACAFHGEGRGAAWVNARGELDLASTPQFKDTLHEALDRALLVILDLRALTFIDSTGLHAIIDTDARARHTGHRLVLIRGCEQVDRLFGLVGLTDGLNIVDLTPNLAPADRHRLVDVSGAAC